MVDARARGSQAWVVGPFIGGGGFAEVYHARPSDVQGTHEFPYEYAIKFVRKESGAERELLFQNPAGAKNVVPIVDSGETGNHYFLVMPLAQRSLEDRLKEGPDVEAGEAIPVLIDVAEALASLSGSVVHRDIKPANILRVEDRWCLSDFGIARYAAASTAPNTWKYSLTPQYAAPEQWRLERATAATDVYALGVVIYRLFSGHLPFFAESTDELREQHIAKTPPILTAGPERLRPLVMECLLKSPQARPTIEEILAELRDVENSAFEPT